MCRKLLEADYDPDRPLHCFRGDTLAMKISSIAYGARYSVSEPSTGSGVRLVPYSDGPQKSGAAPPIRFSDAAAPGPNAKIAHAQTFDHFHKCQLMSEIEKS